MQLPAFLQGDSLARLLQGAAAGALAIVIIGFNWGGWTLGSTAEKMAEQRTNKAVVAALAPICAEKFRSASDAQATLVKLKAVDSWKQDSFVTDGGWATFPGSEPNRNVAEACARLLNESK